MAMRKGDAAGKRQAMINCNEQVKENRVPGSAGAPESHRAVAMATGKAIAGHMENYGGKVRGGGGMSSRHTPAKDARNVGAPLYRDISSGVGSVCH